jgi:hypothetical protein
MRAGFLQRHDEICIKYGSPYLNTHTAMKTTLDIADALMLEAKQAAQSRGMTLRALVEEGLHEVLTRMRQPKPFELRDCAVGGQGWQPGQENLGWNEVRDMIYGDRG